MYDSNDESISIDQAIRNYRTEVLRCLYDTEFNLIPMYGKKPCVEWKQFQTERVSVEKLNEWKNGNIPRKNGKNL